jgi:hypothetical protein
MIFDKQREYEEYEDDIYDGENICCCCGKRMHKQYESDEYGGSSFHYIVWVCPKCG